MKTLRIFLVIMLVLVVVKAYALKPQSVPQDIQAEAAESQIIFVGKCPHQGRDENCVIAQDVVKDVFWVLLFNNEGVLFKVVAIIDGKEQQKWVHPSLSV